MFGEMDGDTKQTGATAAQLWRANQCGLLTIRAEPGPVLERTIVKELLAAAAREGLWQPVRAPRGPVRA
jgi:hypothetical protein